MNQQSHNCTLASRSSQPGLEGGCLKRRTVSIMRSLSSMSLPFFRIWLARDSNLVIACGVQREERSNPCKEHLSKCPIEIQCIQASQSHRYVNMSVIALPKPLKFQCQERETKGRCGSKVHTLHTSVAFELQCAGSLCYYLLTLGDVVLDTEGVPVESLAARLHDPL